MLSNAEKVKIRVLLGYQNAYRYKNTRLESALEGDQVDADGEAIIRDELAGIAEIDKELRAGGVGYTSAGVQAVDKSLRFSTERGQSPEDKLRKIGRMHIGRLATFFGMEILSDYFGMSGYGGDPWSQGAGTKQCAGSFNLKLG